ncbi:MAG: undecaprenyldiphospho-muramoylpentapeptide beta-N-acetylglucosaminyltransferase [Flavobacteriaceae bacterium]|nr:undecaprenyldiphospho-muramoylpentapeptide beta-N-acetylglucosaminyltransferase [Flavobacteriaceae bacterium]|tara:strand:+ start:37390 stop:38484 length:1095 start_codon:yes stop_codon:yes gene_type:complete
MKRNKIIFSGGGTGGHIYPAISIAKELISTDKNYEILFVGARNKMEMNIVPKYGFNILGLWISGFNRTNFFKNIIVPVKLLVSVFQSIVIIKKFRPEIVVGTGGYASGPVLFVANILRIPTLIQEQNSYPGITNKILSKKVNTICVAYKNLDKFFPEKKIVITGNPIRSDIYFSSDSFDHAIDYYNLDINKKTLLVVGGSLGSKEINKNIFLIIDYLEYLNIQVIWQCGKLYFDKYKDAFDSKNIKLYSYIEDIKLAFSASDFIISRAGASSVSELSVVGKPVIFIPSPNVAENHQFKNAKSVVENDAAILIEEKDLKTELKKQISILNSSAELRNKLSKNIKKLAYVDASKDIVKEIKKLIVL